jgi:hypothetical protein
MSYSQYLQDVIGDNKLLMGIVGSVDVANTIGQSITLSDDINRSVTVQNRINEYVSKTLLSLAQSAGNFGGLGTTALMKQALADLPSRLEFIMANLRLQTIQSAGGYRITSMLLGQETKIYSALNQIDLLTSVLFDVPAAIAKRKAIRFWSAGIADNFLAERDLYTFAQNGLANWETLIDRYRQEDGLNLENAKNLVTIRQNQIGKPSLADAWYFVQKGLKPKKFFDDLATLGASWSKDDAKALYEFYFYDPSPSEILRLSDFVPLDSEWIERKLTGAGMNPEDKFIYKAALEKRVLRDEINKAWGLFLDCYQWGLFGATELNNFLVTGKFTTTEITWRTNTADMLKLKLRVKLMRDAEIYLYRKSVLSENQLLTRLQNLNIMYDIANAIVRNEAAKRGIDWEIGAEGESNLVISVNNPAWGNTNPTVGSHWYITGNVVVINGNPIDPHYVSYWLLDDVVYGVAEPSITVTMDTNHTVKCMFDEEPPEE